MEIAIETTFAVIAALASQGQGQVKAAQQRVGQPGELMERRYEAKSQKKSPQ